MCYVARYTLYRSPIMDYLDDLQRTQTISEETAQAIRDYIDGKVSTGRIAASVVSKVREEMAHKEAYLENKIAEHDHILMGLAKSFSHVTGFLGKVTGKK